MSDMAHASQHRVHPSARERLEGQLARALAHVPGAWLLRLIGERPLVVDGRTLDAHLQFLLAAQRRKRRIGLTEPTPASGRARYRRETQAVAAVPTPVAAVREMVVDGDSGPLAARHYAPMVLDDAPIPLLLFLHGGGFVIGDLDTHDEQCRLLCRHGTMHVVSVAYRLAPEHPFPNAVDDACAALRWALANAQSLGADPSMVCIGGDSAGANLAAGASLALAREGRPIAAQLLLYPATDANGVFPSRTTFSAGYLLEMRDVDAFSLHYLGADQAVGDDPRASPARATDLSLSPPTMVVTAGFDVLRDEGQAFAAALRSAGVRVHEHCADGLVHGFLHLTTVVPAARQFARKIATDFSAMARTHP
ncbi:MAG: alpha/beta hydrolase [Gemmatimonadaceae bacterium]|nr:alpha/beta hydrolase [Gemmatimonadaceae bacterium]